ncbi:unnamed protein product [Echinostoma caproni]|uniref:Ovule protein n=1 Tax=Echinostoma caproni TaxID=27848 RepID=A0A183A5U6_9TREM|nr:unnamed protein product [Echinostoma caproni]
MLLKPIPNNTLDVQIMTSEYGSMKSPYMCMKLMPPQGALGSSDNFIIIGPVSPNRDDHLNLCRYLSTYKKMSSLGRSYRVV